VELILKHLWKDQEARKPPEISERQRWTPPPVGSVCINVDAALFLAARRMGCGIVMRDHSGSFILSVSEGIQEFPAPELAEAIAVRRGLAVAKERGFDRAVLVSDCQTLIQRISAPGMDHSPLGALIADIRSLATDFQSCTFKFNSRNLNVVAHKLARSAEPSSCNMSVGVIPGLIREELGNDVI
jgi:ribonuclease HI